MAYTRRYPNNIASGGSTVKECIINDDKDIKALYDIVNRQIDSSGAANGSRQCVMTGKFDSNGMINFLTAHRIDGVPYVGIACESQPAILSFANGYGTYGPKDIIKRLDSHNNTAWKLEDNTIVYLYIDYSPSTGVLSFGYSYDLDTYSYERPPHPMLNQHWYNQGTDLMYCWNGTVWQKVYRIFVAKVIVDEGKLPEIHPYSALSRTTALDEFTHDEDNNVCFREDGELKNIKAPRFIGTADMALRIPYGKVDGANIWIEEIL